MVVAEVSEEVADNGFLLLIEIVDVVEFVDIAEMGKHLVGRGHILVDVVEVGDEQLAPAIEVVEGLVETGNLNVGAIKVADKFDGVGNTSAGVTAEQVADGDIGGRPEGFSGQAGQGVVEKQRGSLVWKNDGRVGQVVAILFENVLSYVFKKCLHDSATTSILLL